MLLLSKAKDKMLSYIREWAFQATVIKRPGIFGKFQWFALSYIKWIRRRGQNGLNGVVPLQHPFYATLAKMKTTSLVTAFSCDFQSQIHKDQLSSFFLSPVLSHLEPREEKGE